MQKFNAIGLVSGAPTPDTVIDDIERAMILQKPHKFVKFGAIMADI